MERFIGGQENRTPTGLLLKGGSSCKNSPERSVLPVSPCPLLCCIRLGPRLHGELLGCWRALPSMLPQWTERGDLKFLTSNEHLWLFCQQILDTMDLPSWSHGNKFLPRMTLLQFEEQMRHFHNNRCEGRWNFMTPTGFYSWCKTNSIKKVP